MKQIKDNHFKWFIFISINNLPQLFIPLPLSTLGIALLSQSLPFLGSLRLSPNTLITGNRISVTHESKMSLADPLNTINTVLTNETRRTGLKISCNTLEERNAADLLTKSSTSEAARGRNSIFIENSASVSKRLQKEHQKVQRHRRRFFKAELYEAGIPKWGSYWRIFSYYGLYAVLEHMIMVCCGHP